MDKRTISMKAMAAVLAAFFFASQALPFKAAGNGSSDAAVTPSESAIELSAAADNADILLDQHRIINVLDDVLAYWNQAKGKTLQRARRLWLKLVESKNKDFFERCVYRYSTIDERREMLDEFLIKLPSRIDAIKQFNKLFETTGSNPVVAGVLDFKARFPEFRLKRDVYLGVSLLRFDGSVRPVGNEEGYPDTLCLGADVLSGYAPEDLQIVIAHELFHLYQFNFLFRPEIIPLRMGLMVKRFELSTLASAHTPLMVEGMAVAASEAVYPNRSRLSYLHLSEDALVQQQTELMRNSQRYLLLMTTLAGPDQYEQWFTNGSDESIPSRGGYLLGYEVVKRMLNRFTFEDLVRMKPAQLREYAEEQMGTLTTDWVMLFAAR